MLRTQHAWSSYAVVPADLCLYVRICNCTKDTHMLLHTDGACNSKYMIVLTTHIHTSAWVERCSNKLNNLSMAFVGKELGRR